ncbi:pentapeptide repeat-containing protein [Micromonospora chersina]|uniref:pentapeptide repeat-containing protein n=1 Tax=Micromonospora chersina TaxID=47854 RepID=UPI0033E027CC
MATLIGLTTVALAVTGVAAWFMWDAAQVPAKLITSPDLAVRAAQLRVDVIRNILAVGAGTGGLIALFLALRRQYVKERVDYADQVYKDRTAGDTKHDATERRVTDLYVKAAEQLGSEKAAVRLAALYALERLGQDNREHRQTIVDLLCAYLRMPSKLPAEIGKRRDPRERDEEDQKLYHEFQVRLAVQKILIKHLRYSTLRRGRTPASCVVSGSPSFWEDISVDLSGAVLPSLNFGRCAVRSINLDGARIDADADFSEIVCIEQALFREARFGRGSNFWNANFETLLCDEAQFAREAIFHGVHATLAQFVGTIFSKPPSFAEALSYVWDFRGAIAPQGNSDNLPPDFVVDNKGKDGFGEVVQVEGRGWWGDDSTPHRPVPGRRLVLNFAKDVLEESQVIEE